MNHVRRTTRWARRTVAVLALALVASGVVVAAPGALAPATAADLTRFDPGLIITDATFWNAGTMDVSSVQAFLNAKGSSCQIGQDGSFCLKNAGFVTNTRPADAQCPAGYTSPGDQSAAQVVVGVARACGINPQVLLVTLQKEQGLVTTTNPTGVKYQKAMGFGCPDSAPCNELYFGFFNQVYKAAWQFRNYTLNPTNYSHRAGLVNSIRFYPASKPECGAGDVLIRNQATANLYNYTPYQPNAAALAAGYGTGDACSSYGNRNFYNYFTDWFGRPDAGDTTGGVDQLTSTSSSVTVGGWAVDPSTASSIGVHVYLDGVGTPIVADKPRPDIGRIFNLGDAHGFSLTLAAGVGAHSVCVYAIGDRGRPNAALGCFSVTVVDRLPIGTIEAVTPGHGQVTVSGWSWDPDTSGPTDVHIYIDGVGVPVRADGNRPDVAAAYGTAPTRGYAYTQAVSPGTHTVCVFAINTGAGANTGLGCRTVAVDVAVPIGTIDALTRAPGQITVSGWSWDPDTSGPTDVHIYIDGVGVPVRADGNRPDVAAAYGTAPTRGYAYTQAVSPGTHTVCVFAINIGPGPNTGLGCRTVAVDVAVPIGTIDAVIPGHGQVTVSGWSWDPDTSGPTDVHIYIDGVGVPVRADGNRPDVAAAYGTAPTRGYAYTQAVSPGTHTVCVFAINTGPGPNTGLDCRTVTVDVAVPIGTIDAVIPGHGQVTVSGWSWDPDTSGPTDVHIYIDGVGVPVRADGNRPDVAAAYGTAPTRGYAYTQAVSPGTHTVCVFAINTGPGPNTGLGCPTFTVE